MAVLARHVRTVRTCPPAGKRFTPPIGVRERDRCTDRPGRDLGGPSSRLHLATARSRRLATLNCWQPLPPQCRAWSGATNTHASSRRAFRAARRCALLPSTAFAQQIRWQLKMQQSNPVQLQRRQGQRVLVARRGASRTRARRVNAWTAAAHTAAKGANRRRHLRHRRLHRCRPSQVVRRSGRPTTGHTVLASSPTRGLQTTATPR